MREVPRGSVSKYKEPLEAITKDKNNSLDVFYSCKENAAAPDSEGLAAAPKEETKTSETLENSDDKAATAMIQESSASLKVEEEETTPKPKVDGSAKKEKKHKKSKGPTSTSTKEAENEVVESRSTTSGSAAAATSASEANETEVVTNTEEETATKFRSVVTKLLKRACCVKSVRSSNS